MTQTARILAFISSVGADVKSLTTSLVGKEPTITAGTTSQFWIGNKTWATILTTVLGVVLTGLSTATSTAVVSSDTILVAVGKLQAQVTLKQNLNLTLLNNTATYTLVLADNGKTVTQNVATANNVTVPQNSSVAFPIGCSIPIVQLGTGQVTIVAGTGTTLRAAVGLKLRAQYSMAFIHKIATNEWVVGGDVTA
ncbi:MAG: hypothetical protein EOO42_01205 [Flavobacteriales bacterium]|nr:MAG: hypothetical protein EOO42_01205 [Flavobacteriales bacterium]